MGVSPDKRPNILVIISDEHRKDAMGCAVHPLVKTPNPDSLAARAEGARRLAAVCDADRVNQRCFVDHADRIAALGGLAACRDAYIFNHTPTPAEQAAMNRTRESGQ